MLPLSLAWLPDLVCYSVSQYPTSRLSLRLPVSQLAWWCICLSPGPSVPIQVQTCRPEARNCLANCHSQPLILSSLTLDCNEISLYSLQFASFRVPAHARLDLPKVISIWILFNWVEVLGESRLDFSMGNYWMRITFCFFDTAVFIVKSDTRSHCVTQKKVDYWQPILLYITSSFRWDHFKLATITSCINALSD